MKRLLLIFCFLLLWLEAGAQESSFKASWTLRRHTPLMEQDLLSSGTVLLQKPSYIRWETLSPVQSVMEMDGESRDKRFRMPTEKDFRITPLEEGKEELVPLRRDLKQLFCKITVTYYPATRLPKTVLLEETDQSWTMIEFKDIVSQ